MIIYTNQKSKRKPKKTAKSRELNASWVELLKKWDVPVSPRKRAKVAQSTVSPYTVPVVPDDRSSRHIASVDTGVGLAPKKQPQQYTGENMLGIGQMHKSNAVPIFKQQDAEDIARMRR